MYICVCKKFLVQYKELAISSVTFLNAFRKQILYTLNIIIDKERGKDKSSRFKSHPIIITQ
jgi:hypothetical protein